MSLICYRLVTGVSPSLVHVHLDVIWANCYLDETVDVPAETGTRSKH